MSERIKEDRNAGSSSYFCSLQRFSIPVQDVFLSTPALQPYLRCAQGTVSGGFLRDLVCCILFEKKLQLGRMSRLQKQGGSCVQRASGAISVRDLDTKIFPTMMLPYRNTTLCNVL